MKVSISGDEKTFFRKKNLFIFLEIAAKRMQEEEQGKQQTRGDGGGSRKVSECWVVLMGGGEGLTGWMEE